MPRNLCETEDEYFNVILNHCINCDRQYGIDDSNAMQMSDYCSKKCEDSTTKKGDNDANLHD
jgi:hypothetical protein